MNKAFIIAGIAVVVISKAIILKSILIDMPAYEQCIEIQALTCGTDPSTYFVIGWAVAVGGFALIILGLKMPTVRRISR